MLDAGGGRAGVREEVGLTLPPRAVAVDEGVDIGLDPAMEVDTGGGGISPRFSTRMGLGAEEVDEMVAAVVVAVAVDLDVDLDLA